jgi:hypothetical protein
LSGEVSMTGGLWGASGGGSRHGGVADRRIQGGRTRCFVLRVLSRMFVPPKIWACSSNVAGDQVH